MIDSILILCGQGIGWIAAFTSSYYSLKTQVDRNKLELDTFKHQVDERVRLLEQQCDRVYDAIETMNSRIDKNFNVLIDSVRMKSHYPLG